MGSKGNSQQYFPIVLRLFREALQLRRKVFTDAESSKLSIVTDTQRQWNFAANDIVHALNIVGKCDAALLFLSDLVQSRRATELDSERAMNLENIATTHACALGGDGKLALESILQAVQIRERSLSDTVGDKSNKKATSAPDDQTAAASPSDGHRPVTKQKEQLLYTYITLWASAKRAGDLATCDRAAKRTRDLYEEITEQFASPTMSTWVSGKLEVVRSCSHAPAGS